MNTKLLLGLALVLISALPASARLVRPWSESELMKASDLVVVATPLTTKDLDETNSLGWSAGKFRGVETTFKVLDAVKGMPANDHIVLHHYRFQTGGGYLASGPDLVSFAPNGTNKLILYLIKDGTKRYAPVTGQADASSSFRPVLTNSFLHFGMPVRPPIADANAAVRHPVKVRVPTGLTIERTSDMLSVALDPKSFESTNLMVGTNMVTGVQSRLFVYPVGEPRPANYSDGLEGGGFVFGTGTIFLHTKPDGIPQKGKSYVVELELSAFETDIPPQHDWSPHSKNYKVLWQRTLKRTAE